MADHVSRRTFLGAALAAAALDSRTAAGARAMEILDCHTHFYDPSRPQGVPWPDKSDALLYRPVYPRHYQALARPLGITGTVVVEASAWVADNDWVLDLAAGAPLIKGLVGHLEPGHPAFAADLERLTANPLFRGIRVSGRDVLSLSDRDRVRDLEILAARGLSLDVNGDVSSLPAVAAVAGAVPQLRIVINHVANVRLDGGPPPSAWLSGMDVAAKRTNVFCKVSGLVEGTGRRDGKAPPDAAFYRPVLDAVWARFGEERVIFGSNWPVSEVFAPLATVVAIVRTYTDTLGDRAAGRYFAGNARTVYLPRAHAPSG